MRVLLIRHAIQFAVVAQFLRPLGKIFSTREIDQSVMLTLNEQHGDMALAHQNYRLAISPVIAFLEELIQQQLNCDALILSETIRTARTDKPYDIRSINAVSLLHLSAIAHDGCQVSTGRRPRDNNLGCINSKLLQIADRRIVRRAYILKLTGVLVLRRQSVAQRNKVISLPANTLPNEVKILRIARVPASAMSPNNDLVTDHPIGLIVQEILLLIITI